MSDLDVIVMTNTAGVITFWSRGAEAAFGHAATAAVGQSLDLIVPAQYQKDHWTGFRRAMAAGSAAIEGRATPFPIRRADGVVESVLGRITLVRNAGGELIGAMAVFG